MKKRGEITLEELIKIILAVAGIAILLLLAFNLYKMFSVKTEAEQAKIHLERIEKSIKKMGNEQRIDYIITLPKGWYLVNYRGVDIFNSRGKYNSTTSCENKDCLCFCDLGELSLLSRVQRANPVLATIVPEFGNSNDLQNSFRDDIYYFFYEQESEELGYSHCESQNICIKIEGAIISSYGDEAKDYNSNPIRVPWIGSNSSATKIKIVKSINGEMITVERID